MKKPKEKKLHIRQKKHFARESLLLIFWLYIFWSECVVRATTNRTFWTNGLIVTALFSLVAVLCYKKYKKEEKGVTFYKTEKDLQLKQEKEEDLALEQEELTTEEENSVLEQEEVSEMI